MDAKRTIIETFPDSVTEAQMQKVLNLRERIEGVRCELKRNLTLKVWELKCTHPTFDFTPE